MLIASMSIFGDACSTLWPRDSSKRAASSTAATASGSTSVPIGEVVENAIRNGLGSLSSSLR